MFGTGWLYIGTSIFDLVLKIYSLNLIGEIFSIVGLSNVDLNVSLQYHLR